MTELDYLKDTYQFVDEATVTEVKEAEKGLAVILDRTIFYPQGGGQPADHGKIYKDGAVFVVSDVRMDENGVVHHFGSFESGGLSKGDQVKLEVDEERRVLSAKLHSAGHLLDVAVVRAGIEGIRPTKGYHFSDGPYVEYEGTLENPMDYIPKVEAALAELLSENLEVEKKDILFEDAQKQGIYAPPGKSARIVNFSGHKGCGCGGTHVNSSGEIGKITIRKISSKKGKTRIAYLVE